MTNDFIELNDIALSLAVLARELQRQTDRINNILEANSKELVVSTEGEAELNAEVVESMARWFDECVAINSSEHLTSVDACDSLRGFMEARHWNPDNEALLSKVSDIFDNSALFKSEDNKGWYGVALNKTGKLYRDKGRTVIRSEGTE